MGAEDAREGAVDPRWRKGLRRIGLIAGLTVLFAPSALHAVFEIAVDRPSSSPFAGSAALHVSSLGAGLLRALPVAALLLVLLLRPERYRVVFWLAPLWFGAETLRKVVVWPSVWAITQSPVDLSFVVLEASVAVALFLARPMGGTGSPTRPRPHDDLSREQT